MEDMMARDHTFVDGRLLSLQDRVAVALRVLNSGDSPVTVGSSLGVNESTVSLVTQVFVEAMWERAFHHISWLGSAQMEKMKRKFNKIHGLPNCCGIVQTAHITFGSQSGDHEENDGLLMQAVVDPDMRFTNIWLGLPGSMNQSSLLHDSGLFMSCEEGTWLNGSKLKISSGGGSAVREYIIGSTAYALLPWLLTPYQLENGLSLSDAKVEFNRRHSAATAVDLRPLTRLKETWKCLEGEGWHPNNQSEMYWTVSTCCMLHNIVIDMEEKDEDQEEGEYEDEGQEELRQVADEDAVGVRGALSQHLIKSVGKCAPLFICIGSKTLLSIYFTFFAPDISHVSPFILILFYFLS